MRLHRPLVGALAAMLTVVAVPAARAATHAAPRPAFSPPAPARIASRSAISPGPAFSTQILHFVVHVFCPLSRQPSPSRVALSFIDAASEPA
ncbi:MAG TPA: hypothetical protein VNY84_05735, partial [Acidimicrobiales bacterium]|nr:hypothetical protein [Acidimicrobiales bacterium]